MKKCFCQFFVALFAMTSFAFVSCSNDDDGPTNGNGETVEVNGVEYPVSPFISMMGGWSETSGSGEFTLSVDREENGIVNVDYYSFKFENTVCPKNGDDVSKMNLVLIPLTENSDDPIWDSSYIYTSGMAVIRNTNPSKSEITVEFEDLKMSKNSKSYTFDGTATLPFSYD